jgi:hypothetical protein
MVSSSAIPSPAAATIHQTQPSIADLLTVDI